jgi:tRNA(fMet)-specific endonuclease VapC
VALLIDTDVLIALERDAGATIDVLLGDEDRAISVITVSELLHGVHRARGADRVRRRAFVEHILAGIRQLRSPSRSSRMHADVWADLADRGEPVGAHDLWIAATPLAHGAGVATRNARRLQRVAGLRVVAA